MLTTNMPDGTPQVTPVWFSTKGNAVLINSARSWTKDRNMRARSNVALHIFDPVDSYRNIQIRGKLVEITEGGGRENINVLARKYTGEEIYLGPKDEVRVNYIVNIQHNSAQG